MSIKIKNAYSFYTRIQLLIIYCIDVLRHEDSKQSISPNIYNNK